MSCSKWPHWGKPEALCDKQSSLNNFSGNLFFSFSFWKDRLSGFDMQQLAAAGHRQTLPVLGCLVSSGAGRAALRRPRYNLASSSAEGPSCVLCILLSRKGNFSWAPGRKQQERGPRAELGSQRHLEVFAQQKRIFLQLILNLRSQTRHAQALPWSCAPAPEFISSMLR